MLSASEGVINWHSAVSWAMSLGSTGSFTSLTETDIVLFSNVALGDKVGTLDLECCTGLLRLTPLQSSQQPFVSLPLPHLGNWFVSQTTYIIGKHAEPLIRVHNGLCFKSTFSKLCATRLVLRHSHT